MEIKQTRTNLPTRPPPHHQKNQRPNPLNVIHRLNNPPLIVRLDLSKRPPNPKFIKIFIKVEIRKYILVGSLFQS